MSQNDWRREYREGVREVTGETGFTLRKLFGVVVCVMIFGAGVTTIGYVFGWFGEAAQVLREEVGPRAINQKYEWFKNAAAQIRAKSANIEALKKRNAAFGESAGPRETWHRVDRETFAQYQTELTGAIGVYNTQVGEYNAQMSMWHTRFTNFGAMPAGWEDITPKGFPEYRSE